MKDLKQLEKERLVLYVKARSYVNQLKSYLDMAQKGHEVKEEISGAGRNLMDMIYWHGGYSVRGSLWDIESQIREEKWRAVMKKKEEEEE